MGLGFVPALAQFADYKNHHDIFKGDTIVHATIQKPIEEIVGYIKTGEKVFVVGCNNCAWK